MMTRRTFAILSIIALMIVWGSTFVVTKAAAREIPPLTLAALRFLIAAIVLVPIAIGTGCMRRMPRPLPWGALFMMALTGIVTFTIAFNYALVYGSATQGALIYALLPAAIALAAVMFLEEKLSRRRIAGIVLSVIGVALVVAGGRSDGSSPHPLLGALWMLGAVVSWVVYTVVAKRVADADHVATSTLMTLISLAMLLPLAAIELHDTPWTNPSPAAWAGMAFLGIAASALAYVVYGRALRELDASLVGAYTNLDPIVGVITAVLFLGEAIHAGQIAGGLIAFAGMWLASVEK